MEISEKIRDIRTQLKLSQEELAAKIGVHQRAISNYEIGLRVPRYNILLRILEFAQQNGINMPLV